MDFNGRVAYGKLQGRRTLIVALTMRRYGAGRSLIQAFGVRLRRSAAHSLR